ncbi:MAG: helix-turn-helix transcriptional regulator [Deltaproteobacteria bacterium]|nr:helix-turn-helix transcriptional regulator [Deltaproteobacteria bacterium]
MSAWDRVTTPTPTPAQCSFTQVLITSSLTVGTFSCPGVPRRTEVEAAPNPEIVLARRGAYVREDEAGAVYIDRTVAAFFEAARPYRIVHPRPRPDVTTVLSLKEPEAVCASLEVRVRAGRCFARSAVRASPALHLRHRELLRALSDHDRCCLPVEEAAVRLASCAVALNHDVEAELSAPQATRTTDAVDVAFAVAELLNARFRGEVSLADLAAPTGYSVFHLCRMFQARMRTSIHKYLTLVRLEHALEALADTDAPVAQVALEHGFSSQSHFTTAFTRWTGESPAAARRRIRGRAGATGARRR